ERLGGLGIDDQFELGRLLDRQVCRPGAFENTSGVDPGFAVRFRNTGSVSHQPAGLDIFARHIAGRQPMAGGEGNKSSTLAKKEWTAADKQRTGTRLYDCCKGDIEFMFGGRP